MDVKCCYNGALLYKEYAKPADNDPKEDYANYQGDW